MSILAAIRPKEPLRHLRWFDMLIVTAILFGQFAYRSTQLYIASLMPQVETAAATEEVRDTAVTGVAYSENMSLQLTLLAIALIYLIIRRFDFKQLPIRFNLGVLFWTPVIFILMGLTADAVTSLSGGYNYFTTEIFQYIKPLSIFDKFKVVCHARAATGFHTQAHAQAFAAFGQVVVDVFGCIFCDGNQNICPFYID